MLFANFRWTITMAWSQMAIVGIIIGSSQAALQLRGSEHVPRKGLQVKPRLLQDPALTFDAYTAGDVISSLNIASGVTATVSGEKFTRQKGQGVTDVASIMVFDSTNPTGGDFDLGTPNEDFGGPGIGRAGRRGRRYENAVARGNVLIISEDDDSSDPDDNQKGGIMTLEFSSSVLLNSLGLLDNEEGVQLEMVVSSGGTTETVNIDGGGDNSYQDVTINSQSIDKMILTFYGSGAITHLDVTPVNTRAGIAATTSPVVAPADMPVVAPTDSPVSSPTDMPVVAPTDFPVTTPTDMPVVAPTDSPVSSPTDMPVVAPTDSPVTTPTDMPVVAPTDMPVVAPTDSPVSSPTDMPVVAPTDSPVTTPTNMPVVAPTDMPVVAPTDSPVSSPTDMPVVAPTDSPVTTPTDMPVVAPTDMPVVAPTDSPVSSPTDMPVVAPTDSPVTTPTDMPVVAPTDMPVVAPTDSPVSSPSDMPVPSSTVAPTDLSDFDFLPQFTQQPTVFEPESESSESESFEMFPTISPSPAFVMLTFSPTTEDSLIEV